MKVVENSSGLEKKKAALLTVLVWERKILLVVLFNVKKNRIIYENDNHFHVIIPQNKVNHPNTVKDLLLLLVFSHFNIYECN